MKSKIRLEITTLKLLSLALLATMQVCKDCSEGAGGSADLKITKSALLSLNHHNFSNTKPIYTK